MKNGLTEEQMEEMKAMGVKFYETAEEAELDYLREGLKRTPEERYLFLMMLMKEGRAMQKAVRIK
jgi:hypothetical protein